MEGAAEQLGVALGEPFLEGFCSHQRQGNSPARKAASLPSAAVRVPISTPWPASLPSAAVRVPFSTPWPASLPSAAVRVPTSLVPCSWLPCCQRGRGLLGG